MKISILIPSKNRLDLLKSCLQTILAQSDDEIEIVVADNASTDDYKTYIDTLSDIRIVYFRQPAPVPVTDNWQTALSLASGGYILMLGDDDALPPDFFETVRPFLSSDSPDILYLAAYHYCYPNVIPWATAGYFAVVGCEFLPNENGPFCLLPHYARDLATSVLEFRNRYGFNAQHFLINRSFVERVADIGPVYQSPYPDFFAAVVTFMLARSIVVIPKPSVIIGISPSSFGAYYYSGQQQEGYEFLANKQVDPSVLNALKDLILPGDMNNTNWLIAVETARRAIASSYPRKLDVNRYSAIQIISILRYRYVDKLPCHGEFALVRAALSGKSLLFFEFLRTAIETVAKLDPDIAPRIVRALERRVGQHPSSYYSMIDIGVHNDIMDAVDWLNGKRPNVKQLSPHSRAATVAAKRKVTMRRLARAAIVHLLPPVRRLYERVARDASRIAYLEAENALLEGALRGRSEEEHPSPSARLNTRLAPFSLRIVITRDRKQTVITPEKFDEFEFKQDDELNIVPSLEAARLRRTPEGHFHIPKGDGHGIRVPLKMTFATFMRFSVPDHLIALTGAGFETLDIIGKAHIAAYAKHLGIKPDMTFLEIGSGIGRDAFQLIDYLDRKGRYIGIDVQRESILWCQKNIARKHPNFEFHHVNAYHELHNPLATKTTVDFKLPASDGSIDRIALGSVFTHIFENEVLHYMREIARVLKPDGLVYATFFLYSDEVVAKSRTRSLTPYNLRFEHPYGDGCYVNDAAYPTGAVAYTDEAMQRMIRNAGLRLDRPYLKGSWSGYYPAKDIDDGQDVAILRIA